MFSWDHIACFFVISWENKRLFSWDNEIIHQPFCHWSAVIYEVAISLYISGVNLPCSSVGNELSFNHLNNYREQLKRCCTSREERNPSVSLYSHMNNKLSYSLYSWYTVEQLNMYQPSMGEKLLSFQMPNYRVLLM